MGSVPPAAAPLVRQASARLEIVPGRVSRGVPKVRIHRGGPPPIAWEEQEDAAESEAAVDDFRGVEIHRGEDTDLRD
jgi:hypothetical protein